jgi:large subunit ribosomal protein L13
MATPRKTTNPEWHHLDAASATLGRLATQAAILLMGKHRTDYTAHMVAPVYVVITNTDKLKVTGAKRSQKKYYHYTGYPGGIKERTLDAQMERDSRKVIEAAVFGMLPKNSLRDPRMQHLKLFPGGEHPYGDKLVKA